MSFNFDLQSVNYSDIKFNSLNWNRELIFYESFFFNWIFKFILYTNHSSPLPIFPNPPPSTPHVWVRVRVMGNHQILAHSVEARPSLPHPRERHPTIWNGFQKASSCFRGRFWYQCQGAHKQTRLQNCCSHAEGLLWSYAGSPAVGLGPWATASLGSLSLWVFLGSTVSMLFYIMILILLAHIITPLLIELCSSAWCLDADLCICFCHLS